MPIRGPQLASFRDPSGFVFIGGDGLVYRQINRCYEDEYHHLMRSGLYKALVDEGMLVEHTEVDLSYRLTAEGDIVIRPRMLPFISYPHEWCFSQIRDAARLTLAVQRRALEHGMTLRTCSGSNVQFDGVKPIFIDTLAFARINGGPRVFPCEAFRRHFLAPLILMSAVDPEISALLRACVDGIPAALAERLLSHARWRSGKLRRLLEPGSPGRPQGGELQAEPSHSGKAEMMRLVNEFEMAIEGLAPGETASTKPAPLTNRQDRLIESRKDFIREKLDGLEAKRVWSFEPESACYGLVAREFGAAAVSFLSSHGRVEALYGELARKEGQGLLPLLMSLDNPSPGLGWAHAERASLRDRGPADLLIAVDILHHLCLGFDVPLINVSEFFCELCDRLIIEFVAPEEPEAQALLERRPALYEDYSFERFEEVFASNFVIRDTRPLIENRRILYLMEATG